MTTMTTNKNLRATLEPHPGQVFQSLDYSAREIATHAEASRALAQQFDFSDVHLPHEISDGVPVPVTTEHASRFSTEITAPWARPPA